MFAGVLGAFLQPDVYADFVAGSGNAVVESLKAVWLAMANGFSISSGIPDVDRLLSRGGMDSMLLTIWLIIGAVTFGAMLEEFAYRWFVEGEGPGATAADVVSASVPAGRSSGRTPA